MRGDIASFATATAQAQEEATARSSDASEHAKVPAPQGMLQHFAPFTDRWYAPGYTPEGIDLTGYSINEIGGRWWSPYTQNPIKGDFPIFGTQGLFLNVGGLVRQFSEIRDIPTPTANTGSGGQNFFGDGKQQTHLTQVALTLDLFSAPGVRARPLAPQGDAGRPAHPGASEPDGVLFADRPRATTGSTRTSRCRSCSSSTTSPISRTASTSSPSRAGSSRSGATSAASCSTT